MSEEKEFKPIREAQNEVDIATTNAEFLAASVVVYKTLGINKEFALACMQELATRRKNGDTFNYEDYIEEEIKKFPKSSGSDSLKVSKSLLDKSKIKNPFAKLSPFQSKNE